MLTEIERLYREHRAGLVRLVERELHDHHDAEDVVQTAFLEAQRALERGTIPRNPRAWLATIALNAGRRLGRRRPNAEPLEEIAAQEVSRQPEIRAALANLPREQRKAVVYRDVLGLSYGETAQQMGTSVDAVTMLLHRGRRRLRQTLGVAAPGLGLWRWAKRAAMPQVAVAKGAATVVVAAGLATTGIVTARLVAPVGAAAPATRPATRAPGNAPGAVGSVHGDPVRERHTAADGSKVSAAPAANASGDAATRAPGPSATAAGRPPPALTLPVSTVHLPTLPTPTGPATVAVSTPVATVTASVPTGTTATVTTPIATVTLPIP